MVSFTFGLTFHFSKEKAPVVKAISRLDENGMRVEVLNKEAIPEFMNTIQSPQPEAAKAHQGREGGI